MAFPARSGFRLYYSQCQHVLRSRMFRCCLIDQHTVSTSLKPIAAAKQSVGLDRLFVARRFRSRNRPRLVASHLSVAISVSRQTARDERLGQGNQDQSERYGANQQPGADDIA